MQGIEEFLTTWAAAEQAGATLVSAPAHARRPGFRFAYLKDPEGNLID